MSTTIHIRAIQPSDSEADEMDALGLRAFTNVAVHRLMFPKGEETRKEEFRFRSQRFRNTLNNASKRFVVAVEETVLDGGTPRKDIIGWARWTSSFEHEPKKSQEEQDAEMREKMKFWPDAMDKEAYRKILEGFHVLDEQWLAGDDPKNYWGEHHPDRIACVQTDTCQYWMSLLSTQTISGKVWVPSWPDGESRKLPERAKAWA